MLMLRISFLHIKRFYKIYLYETILFDINNNDDRKKEGEKCSLPLRLFKLICLQEFYFATLRLIKKIEKNKMNEIKLD